MQHIKIASSIPKITKDDIPAIMGWLNCAEVDVDESGDVWVAGPMVGHWLNDEKKEAYVKWREAQ